MRRTISKINIALDDLNRLPANIKLVVPVLCRNIGTQISNLTPIVISPQGIYFSGKSLFLHVYDSFFESGSPEPYKGIAIVRKIYPYLIKEIQLVSISLKMKSVMRKVKL